MAKFIVCPECEGTGMITNPEVVGNGYTRDELDDLGDDFMDNFRDGVYNIQCPCCLGQRVTTRKEYRLFTGDQRQSRADRLLSLQESGIYPGHRDYF